MPHHATPDTPGREPEPRQEPAAREPEATPATALLGLQRSHGNAWVARAVERGLMRQPDAEQLAKQAFIARGVMPSAAGLDFQPSSRIGGFNVRYDPAASELVATLRVGIEFLDGLTIDATTGTITPGHADFATAAADVRDLNPDIPARVAAVQADWHWDAAGQSDWMSTYETQTEVAWGGRHHFTSDRWDDLYANVRVDLDVHSGHRANDHCRATVYKNPEGSREGPGAMTNWQHGNPTGTTGTFTSSQIGSPFDFLNYSLQFERNSADVRRAFSTSQEAMGDDGDALLDKLIVDLQRGTATGGAHLTITGHASSSGDGEHNQRLSRRRAEAVATYLRSHGDRIAGSRMTIEAVGSDGAAEDETWQRVDIRVGDGRAQVTMTHETGHMFGLDDEYASPVGGVSDAGAGTPGTIGDPVDHTPLSTAMGPGMPGAVVENNDNIMSVGNVIRPQHYSTFLEGLNRVAAPEAFHYGGAGHSPDVIPDLIGPDVPHPGGGVAVA